MMQALLWASIAVGVVGAVMFIGAAISIAESLREIAAHLRTGTTGVHVGEIRLNVGSPAPAGVIGGVPGVWPPQQDPVTKQWRKP